MHFIRYDSFRQNEKNRSMLPNWRFVTNSGNFYDFQGSSIGGIGGLMVGDKITQLNECPIRGSTSWNDCLSMALNDVNIGFCIPDNFIKEHDESVPGI